MIGGESMIKGIKLRLYPNKAQQNQLLQMFGNNRFVWNQMLSMAKARYKNNPSSRFLTGFDMNNLLPRLKQEYPFLKESDAGSLQVSNHNLAQAFKMLFKHQGGYPRFKSRRSAKKSYKENKTYISHLDPLITQRAIYDPDVREKVKLFNNLKMMYD